MPFFSPAEFLLKSQITTLWEFLCTQVVPFPLLLLIFSLVFAILITVCLGVVLFEFDSFGAIWNARSPRLGWGSDPLFLWKNLCNYSPMGCPLGDMGLEYMVILPLLSCHSSFFIALVVDLFLVDSALSHHHLFCK